MSSEHQKHIFDVLLMLYNLVTAASQKAIAVKDVASMLDSKELSFAEI